MTSKSEALHAAARTFAGTSGSFNGDVLAALRQQYGGTGGFSEMMANVPGGFAALLANPTFGASTPDFYLNLSNATNATISDSQGRGTIMGGGGGAITIPAAASIASRSSGKEMLAVYFDASGTTHTTITDPEHELFYAWDFGDDVSETWAYGTDTTRNKNVAYGPQAAHVYKTAGTKTWTLVVIDGSGGTATRTGTVTVSAWTDAETYYIANGVTPSPGGNGIPGTVSAGNCFNETTWSGVVSHMTTGKRVLLRKGDTWTVPSAASLSSVSAMQVGQYGLSGARPILNSTSTSSSNSVFSFSGSTCSDIRLTSLAITRTVPDINDASAIYGNYTNDLLLNDMDISGDHQGVAVGIAPGTLTTGVFIVDSNIHDIGVDNVTPTSGNEYYGLYLESVAKLAIVGSRVYNVVTGHCVRLPGVQAGVLANCDFANGRHGYGVTPGNSSVVTIRGFTNNAGMGTFGGIYTEKVLVRDNTFTSTVTNTYLLQVASQNDSDASRHRNVIVENNYFVSTTTTPGINSEVGSRMTIRNNIISMYQGTYGVQILANEGNTASISGNNPSDTKIYNNTFWKSSANPSSDGWSAIVLYAIDTWNSCTGTIIKNNLAYNPYDTKNFNQSNGGAGADLVTSVGAGTVTYTLDAANSSNTQVRTVKPWAATTPAVYADYAPNGYGLNAGVSVPVIKDFFNATITGTRELGAIQV